MSLSEYTTKDLSEWDDKICEIARNYGLDWFDINYEICDYYEMIGHMSYHGMPSHYNHWSYGKTFERTHLNYNMGQSGLPYEMIINSNPYCVSYDAKPSLFTNIDYGTLCRTQ